VLVLHAWWGLSDGIRRFCDRLAGEGFVALAPDLCGGRTAGTIAEDANVDAVVLYYGTASGIDHARQPSPVLGHFAENDDLEPADEVGSLEDDVRRARRPARFHVYPGVGHWFAEADRPHAYDEAAASLALRRTVGFLRSQLQREAVAPPPQW